MAILEILEDERRVVEREIAVDEDGNLPFRIQPHDLGMLRLVPGGPAEGNGDELVLEPLLVERDAHLAGEEAERSGVESHGQRNTRALRLIQV
jgi:hypothetical protein